MTKTVTTWLVQFNPDYTKESDFTRIDGSTVTANLMSLSHKNNTASVLCAVTENCSAVELAYAGDRFAMLAVLPNGGDFTAFEKAFDQAELEQIVSHLDSMEIKVKLPGFKFGTESISLKDPLINLGMQSAFDDSKADFSGIDGTYLMSIDDVYQKAFIEVNEQGTEASAATAVVMDWESVGSNSDFIADRPFIYLIRDRQTGAVLFMGRVMDPNDEGNL